MSSINLTKLNPNAVPAPANGEVEFFVDSSLEPAIKLPNGRIKTLGSLYGTQFNSKKRDTTQTTSGTNFTVYDALQLNNLPQGNYRIDMRWVWGYASVSNDIRVQWLLNGALLISEHMQEPKDGGADQRHHECSFAIENLTGNNTIEILFASSGGNQARMYESQVVVYRVD
jgi:hypothetical protein